MIATLVMGGSLFERPPRLPLSDLLLKSTVLCVGIIFMDIKKIDLNLLIALEALLAERNVSRAARRLNLSQPALSAQLNRLRALFADPLFSPAQRGVIPSARALELEAPLRAALDQLRTVVAGHTPFDPSTADLTITIAASDYAQTVILAPLVAALKHEAPALRMSLRSLQGAELYQEAEAGIVDCALITPQTAPDRLRARPVMEERYGLALRVGHPAVKKPMTLDTFCALDHVIVSPRGGGFRGATDDALDGIGRKRRVALSVSSFLVALEAVATSDMIAVVPERLVKRHADRLKILEPPLTIPGFSLSLVWHERTHAHPAHKWFRDRLALEGKTVSK
jgi:DNA-binding transcriptional LysR family regulator